MPWSLSAKEALCEHRDEDALNDEPEDRLTGGHPRLWAADTEGFGKDTPMKRRHTHQQRLLRRQLWAIPPDS
jgi:hypothetical protein